MNNSTVSTPQTGSNRGESLSAKSPYQKILVLCAIISVVAIIIGGYFLFFKDRSLQNQALETYKKSIPALEQKVKENPKDAVVNNEYAYALYVTADDTKAIQAYSDAIALNPNDATAYNNLGNLYRKQKAYSKAIEAYNKSIELQPSQINAYVNLGNLYIYDLKDYDSGNRVFTEAISRNPQDVNLKNMYGKVYEQHKQNDKAIAMYREVLQIDPNNATAKQSLEKLGGSVN